MTAVIDASVVVAALIDTGPTGSWALASLASSQLAAPELLLAEVANVLRRAEMTKAITNDVGAISFRDLLDLNVHLFGFEPLADRIWELRTGLTPYDAWYVALAEALEAPLMTLDSRLATAPGPTCSFDLPPA